MISPTLPIRESQSLTQAIGRSGRSPRSSAPVKSVVQCYLAKHCLARLHGRRGGARRAVSPRRGLLIQAKTGGVGSYFFKSGHGEITPGRSPGAVLHCVWEALE